MTVQARDDAFWQSLRRSVQAAEQMEREELAQAEQRLAETQPGPGLTQQQIAAMVLRATTPDAQDLQDENLHAGDRHTDGAAAAVVVDERGCAVEPAPVNRFARMQRVLAAAAAVMIMPKFLAAATVVTVLAVTSYMVTYSTHTLPFQDAVYILMDEQQPEVSRESAQGRVAGDLFESIGIVRAVTGEGGSLGEQARATLRRMQSLLADSQPFVVRWFADQLVATGDEVADNSLEPERRQEALFRLGQLLDYGLEALKAIERRPGSPGLKNRNRAILMQLEQQLR